MKLSGIKNALLSGTFLYRVDRKTGRLLTRHPLLAKARRNTDRAVGEMSRRIYYRKHGKIVANKLFVMTYDNEYTCNARYIVEEIQRQNLPINIVWVCARRDPTVPERFPEGITLARRGSAEMFEHQATAKIWLDNALNCSWYRMPKKEGQIYINTWHGSMGIKKLSGSPYWMQRAEECGKMTDYCVANSAFEEAVYRETFWKDTPIWRCGHARNDILFRPAEQKKWRQKVAEHIGLNPEERWLLYAPTFRDDGDTACFDIDYIGLKEALEKRFGGVWNILVRKHYKNRGVQEEETMPSWLKNASDYPDMQELLATADAGITDYSSWAYDYVLTRRPLFLYVPDKEKYDQSRGFYYPLEETPFALVQNNEQLQEAVLRFDDAAYQPRIDAFLQARGCYEDGNAAYRVVEQIKRIMGLVSAEETPKWVKTGVR